MQYKMTDRDGYDKDSHYDGIVKWLDAADITQVKKQQLRPGCTNDD